MTSNINKVVRGRAWTFGDSVDTDIIYPYYRYPSAEEVRKHTMEALRPEFPNEVKEGDIVVAGRNFGCGSSRPATVLRDVGVAAVIAESISRLLLRNNVAQAIPTFVAPGITGIVENGDELEIDYPQGVARNPKTGAQVALTKYPPMIEEIYEAGGMLEYARRRFIAET
jgi:3-isopropylmalate dehydratase small subunit